MKNYIVKATIEKMGRQCATCVIHFEITVQAEDSQSALQQAKKMARYDETTHKFKINLIKELS
jgi:hypothetical protein